MNGGGQLPPGQFHRTDGGRRFSKRPKQSNDCTVRSLAVALSISYDAAYDAMKLYTGRKPGRGAASPILYRGLGFEHIDVPDNTVRYSDWIEMHPKGRWLVLSHHHVAAILDGVLYDETATDLYIKDGGVWRVR